MDALLPPSPPRPPVADRLAAVHGALRRALAACRAGRVDTLLAALGEARDGLRRHRTEVEREGGLYLEVRRDATWLRPDLEGCRRRLRQLEGKLRDLEFEVCRIADGHEERRVAVRRGVEAALHRLRELEAGENALWVERWNEPAALD